MKQISARMFSFALVLAGVSSFAQSAKAAAASTATEATSTFVQPLSSAPTTYTYHFDSLSTALTGELYLGAALLAVLGILFVLDVPALLYGLVLQFIGYLGGLRRPAKVPEQA